MVSFNYCFWSLKYCSSFVIFFFGNLELWYMWHVKLSHPPFWYSCLQCPCFFHMVLLKYLISSSIILYLLLLLPDLIRLQRMEYCYLFCILDWNVPCMGRFVLRDCLLIYSFPCYFVFSRAWIWSNIFKFPFYSCKPQCLWPLCYWSS